MHARRHRYHQQFLAEYLDAFKEGYLMFLSEAYHSHPFRCERRPCMHGAHGV